MRIACIHIPQFALQSATRLDPSLRGAPVAIVGGSEPRPPGGLALAPGRERSGALHSPVVVACSRAAWGLGVRLGMTAAAARAMGGGVRIVAAEAAVERETVRAIADSLLAATPIVDVGGRVGAGGAHLAMYTEVPAKLRGHSYGERVIALLDELGVTGRVGIADDRFTAWVAAAHLGGDDGGVIAVPRGGSAAFLSPRPLALLAIAPEVQHMLEALGVRTLGEFAALPAPSVARPLEADYQGLARGEGGAGLRAYVPDAAIREDVVTTAGLLEGAGLVSGPAAVALVARRIALRLAGRGRLATQLEIAVGERELVIDLPAAAGAEVLARVLAPALNELPNGAQRLRVVVAGEVSAGDQHELAPAPLAMPIDPIAMVLSTPGSASLHSWALQAPTRREPHRRTRRGKQRRRVTPAAQSRLW